MTDIDFAAMAIALLQAQPWHDRSLTTPIEDALRAAFAAGRQAALPDDAALRGLSASDVACYKWPEDTAEHKALRDAYVEGAMMGQAAPQPEGGQDADAISERLARLQQWAKEMTDAGITATLMVQEQRERAEAAEKHCAALEEALREHLIVVDWEDTPDDGHPPEMKGYVCIMCGAFSSKVDDIAHTCVLAALTTAGAGKGET